MQVIHVFHCTEKTVTRSLSAYTVTLQLFACEIFKTNTKIRYFFRICRLRILFKTGDKIKIELAEPTLKQTGVLKTVKDSPCRPVLHHFITACRRIRIAAELSSFVILSFCHVCIRIVRRHARSIVLYSNPAATVALGCRQSLPRLWWWLGAHK